MMISNVLMKILLKNFHMGGASGLYYNIILPYVTPTYSLSRFQLD